MVQMNIIVVPNLMEEVRSNEIHLQDSQIQSLQIKILESHQDWVLEVLGNKIIESLVKILEPSDKLQNSKMDNLVVWHGMEILELMVLWPG